MSTKLKRKGVHMRKILKTDDMLLEMFCDCCKKKIQVENGIVKEGIFSIDYPWGYFSKKDGEIHSIDLCEECYDRIIIENGINVCRRDNTELI